MSALHIRHLRHHAGGREILNIGDLSLPAGGRLLLLGPSGSGKTTLLSLMAGLLCPQAGTVRFGDDDYGAMGAAARDRLRRRAFGFVFQKIHLIGHLTLLQNVRLSADAPDAAFIAALLARLGLGGRETQAARDLSHGEAQRAAIARALAHRPQIVFADEPTSALDDAHAEAVARLLLDETAALGATLVVATHDARLKPYFDNVLELAA